jgi:hypothetical protein
MSITTRRWIGVVLMCVSAVAFMAQMVGSQPRVIGADSEGGASIVLMEFQLELGWPVIVCGMASVLCLVWPARKPPKLAK